jgi:hypothetical protein
VRTSGEIPADIVDYLRLHHIVTLSTSSFTGMPHADTVMYVNDDQAIYFFGMEGTALVRNVHDSHYVSFTIDDYTTDWRKVRELQGVGRGVPGDELAEAHAIELGKVKFGPRFVRPAGVLHVIKPNEMHFVDYEYAEVAAGSAPERIDRVVQIEGAPALPQRGPVSTELDQMVFEPGQIIFRPGDRAGQYFVVMDGEVEIRGEGYGADQTIVRVNPGQMFGDQAALYGQRGAITAHAVTKVHLLAVRREAMRDLLLHDDGGS